MDEKKLIAIRDLLLSAEKSLVSAKKMIASSLKETNINTQFSLPVATSENLYSYDSGETKIIEGIFTGDSMIGADNNVYPVPQNYASKSHLLQGSKLKATIFQDGRIMYKIIEEMEAENKVGIVTKDGDKYQVVSEEAVYNILLASITYLKVKVGDNVAIKVPKGVQATFAVIEAVIPKTYSSPKSQSTSFLEDVENDNFI